MGLLNSVVTRASFIGILWAVSGPLTLARFGIELTIPGYMVWVALLYAIAGSLLSHAIGRPLIGLNFAQQRFEADFRYGLVRVREHAESVALYGGESQERAALLARFGRVVVNWWALVRAQKRLIWAQSLYAQKRPYLPIGTLRAAVAFPSPASAFDDTAIAAALADARLPQFAARLDEEAAWDRRLSPGEQQRLAVARALLNRPRWLFLDEATSALDEATGTALYRLLIDRLPGSALVSIAHDPSVAGFHQRRVPDARRRRRQARRRAARSVRAAGRAVRPPARGRRTAGPPACGYA